MIFFIKNQYKNTENRRRSLFEIVSKLKKGIDEHQLKPIIVKPVNGWNEAKTSFALSYSIYVAETKTFLGLIKSFIPVTLAFSARVQFNHSRKELHACMNKFERRIIEAYKQVEEDKKAIEDILSPRKPMRSSSSPLPIIKNNPIGAFKRPIRSKDDADRFCSAYEKKFLYGIS